MKPSKSKVNYRYPEECCGKCDYSYQNSYGDYQCVAIEGGEIIDIGGICNLYHESGNNVGVTDSADVVSEPSIEVDGSETVPAECCVTCRHSFLGGDGKPYCIYLGFLEITTLKCDNFQLVTEV
jgi:hypothetical protein